MSKTVHLVQGAMAAAALQDAEVGLVIGVTDDLTYGPCSTVPVRHARLRRQFWKNEAVNGPGGRWLTLERVEHAEEQVFGATELGQRLGDLSAYDQVIVWTSSQWREFLFFCWAMDAIKRARVERHRVVVATPRAATQAVAWLQPEGIADALSRAAPLVPDRMNGGVRVWKAFCAKSPASIESLRRPRPVLVRFRTLSRHYADILPRVRSSATGPVMLSRLDATIFRALSEYEWRGFSDLFRDPKSPVTALVRIYGDLPISRLWHWSRHRDGAFVERSTGGSAGPSPTFRLTHSGRHLLANGLERWSDAPQLPVGGYTAYAPGAPWVVITRGSSWRLAPRKGGPKGGSRLGRSS